MGNIGEMNDTFDQRAVTAGLSPEGNGGTKKGKKHPPPPKPRPPSPPPKEIEAPLSSVDLDGSTSEEDDTPARRVSSRRNKKQKRAQKQNEVKEDRAVLKEMKTPIASTSGPLLREQEKIRKLYPRKFLSVVPASKGSGSSSMADVSLSSSEENDNRNGNIVKSKVARQNSLKKVENDKRRTSTPRATRTSSRIATSRVGNADNHSNSEEKKVNINSPQRSLKPATKIPTSVNISNDSNVNAKKIINVPPSPTVTSPPKSNSPSPASSVEIAPSTQTLTSPPQVTGPILKEKRQRRLPKRLMSPDVADLPPVLFRIASSGTINIFNEDESPPKLSPIALSSPGVSRSWKRPGKENLQLSVSARKNLEASMINCTVRIPPLRMDVRPVNNEDKIEDNGEPARKRVARTRTTSSSKENEVTLINPTEKPEAQEIKSRIGTRASSRKSKT